MSRINNKYSKEFKLAVVKRYLKGNGGYQTVTELVNKKIAHVQEQNTSKN